MKIKIFQHPAIYVVEDLVNNYLSDIKNEDIVKSIIKEDQKLVCWDVRNPFTFEMIEFNTPKH